MPPTDAARIRHIRDAARQACDLARDRTRADLDADVTLSLSLTRLLEIIGEAARGLTPAFRQANPDVPWRKMTGMRDRLVHAYFDVDLDVVWQTVTQDLPPLLGRLEEISPNADT
jgi:uncharacterized protein with HEPN domain